MNKKLTKSVSVFAALLVAAALVFTGCPNSTDEVTLSSIAVDASGAKTTYTVGDTFSTDGVVVNATYSDSSTTTVELSECQFTGYDMATAGTQTVTVTYSEMTATYDITVSVPVTLSSISVEAIGAKTAYTVGDTFSSDGVVVTATYSDSTTGTIANSDCTFTGYDMTTAGTQTVTVTYSEKTATYDVTVSNPVTLSSISVNSSAASTTYTVGDTFSSDGVVVTATYSDSTTGTIANSECTFTGHDISTAGTQTVTVTYKEKTATYEIKVSDPTTLSSIKVDANSAKTSYTVGDTFSSDNVVVTATYSNSTTGTVANSNCTFKGYDMATAGTQTVTVTYKEKTATYEIKVAEPVTLSSISITTLPTTTKYIIGGTIDTTGMVVSATYSDGTTKNVASSDYTLSGFDSSAVADAQTVTVTYSGKTAIFTVKIISNVKQAGTASGVATMSGTYTAYLGGDSCQVALTSATVGGEEVLSSTTYIGTSYQNSSEETTSYACTWNGYDSFYGTTGLTSDFTLVYTFTEESLGANNWNNWVFALMDSTDSSNVWYLRADNYSNSKLTTYPNVALTNTYTWDSFYADNFKDKTLTLTVTGTSSSITAVLNNGTSDIYTATATPPASGYTFSMGGESCKIDISSVKVNTVEQLTEAVSYGTDNGDGTYTLTFGTTSYTLDELLSIDDDWTVVVTFTQASEYASNWNSYNFMLTNGEDSSYWTCRCDNWAWGKLTGYTDYTTGANTGMTNTFNWTTFSENFADKTLTLTIAKTDASIIATLNNGTSDIWSCTNSAAE